MESLITALVGLDSLLDSPGKFGFVVGLLVALIVMAVIKRLKTKK